MSKDMNADMRASRRSFLKSGAMVAAPLAALAPVAALADDGARAKLARLEDERAIEGLQRQVLKKLNGSDDCAELRIPADAVQLDAGLRAISEDMAHDTMFDIAADGLTAHSRCTCTVELETSFDGDSTLEQMARLQGHGSHRHSESRVLQTSYAKGKDGWQVTGLNLA
ncbi:MAG: hypothetical protein WA842_09680 [Croceibacterium sp.]